MSRAHGGRPQAALLQQLLLLGQSNTAESLGRQFACVVACLVRVNKRSQSESKIKTTLPHSRPIIGQAHCHKKIVTGKL